MASKLALYDTGYDDDRFEHVVSPSFHCIICTNVIKDPVMCHHNEHLFCRACIAEHLKNSQTCPSCMDPLTIDTLSQAPRGIKNLLNELKIKCEFFDRGCEKFMELGNLESHLEECGFAPAVCSNEGCEIEVNKRDLLYHETADCERRRVKCHSCNDIRQEMDIVQVNLAAMNEKLEKIGRNGKAAEENLVELVNKQFYKLEERSRSHEADNLEIKKSLNEITKQLERMTQQESQDVQADKEQMKKRIAEANVIDREPTIVTVGGENNTSGRLKSVEMFSLSNGKWTRLEPMSESRSGASSVVYDNQIIVMGSYVKSIEKLSLNAVQADQSITWEDLFAKLPVALAGHCSVVYNGRLIVIGGYDATKTSYCDSITEVSFNQPYSSKVLATMRKRKCYHGVVLFGDVMMIVGGRERLNVNSALRDIVMYNITTNEFKELALLPYPVCEMATVKWGDDNVIIMGGVDSNGKQLSAVLIYNIRTEKCHTLPDMKYKRRGCVAAVVRDTVIVMGGEDKKGNYLKSVESFRFDRYTWKELPEMHEERYRATAVVC